MTNTQKLRELLILRHAKSDHSNPELTDFERPLNERGREDAHTIGAWIAQQNLTPDCIFCSSSKRTQQTLKRAQSHFDKENQIATYFREDLYEAELSQLLSALRQTSAECHRLLVVGHNPGLETLLTYLIPSVSPNEQVKLFPTSSLAHVILPADWQSLTAGCGKLLNLWYVKQLPHNQT